MDVIVSCSQISKEIGDKKILDQVSFDILSGECFGLLGPNGAGKSTTLKIVYGQMEPTSGDLMVLNLNSKISLDSIKRRIGVIPQDDGLDLELTVHENLKMFSSYYDVKPFIAEKRIPELVEELKLQDHLNHMIDQLSGGLKRRVAIARALLHAPEVLILDEPTTGLDPQMRNWMWNYIRQFKKQSKSVLLTTHYMEEAEALCDRIAIIDNGRILSIGAPKQLIYDHIGVEVLEFTVKESEANYYIEKYRSQGIEAKAVYQDRIMLCFKQHEDSKKIVPSLLSDEIILRKPTLNDVFLALSGSQLRDLEA